jgi:hypothetical protein
MPIKDPKRLCESILAIDNQIISAALVSFAGIEIANAIRPSAPLFMPNFGELAKKQAVPLISGVEAFSKGQEVLGELEEIVVIFKRLKALIAVSRPDQMVIAVITMKEAEDKRIAFQISKLLDQP